jgi:hypothetical protein
VGYRYPESSLHVIDGVGGFNVQGDRLVDECLDKGLQRQRTRWSRLLPESVVIRESATVRVFKLLSGDIAEGSYQMRSSHEYLRKKVPFVLDFSLDVVDSTQRFPDGQQRGKVHQSSKYAKSHWVVCCVICTVRWHFFFTYLLKPLVLHIS